MPRIIASTSALAVNPGLGAIEDLSLARLARFVHRNVPLVPDDPPEEWNAVAVSAALAFLVGATLGSRTGGPALARSWTDHPRVSASVVIPVPSRALLSRVSAIAPADPAAGAGAPPVRVIQSGEEKKARSWMDLPDLDLGQSVRGLALQIAACRCQNPFFSSLALLEKYLMPGRGGDVSFVIPSGTLRLAAGALPGITVRILRRAGAEGAPPPGPARRLPGPAA